MSTPSLGRRLGARLLDAALLSVVGGAYGSPLGFGPAWLVVHAAVVYAYFVICDVARGATLGKWLLGLRVDGADGRVPMLDAAARREAFMLLGAVPYAGPLLALVSWVAIGVAANRDPEGRGPHDTFAGGTRVVAA